MIIKQQRIGRKLVELSLIGACYYVELREDAGNWMPWEVRADGTRPIMGQPVRDLARARIIYNRYIERTKEND